MKISIVILFIILQILFASNSNAKTVQKRWARDEWPSMMDRWRRIGEDIRRRTDLSRDWFRERFSSPFTPLNFRPLVEQPKVPNSGPQNFDPSVVIVDKPEVEHDRQPFGGFDFDFPLSVNFDRPKFWPFEGLFNSQRSWWRGPNVCIERRIIEGTEQVKEQTNQTRKEQLEVEGEDIPEETNPEPIRDQRSFILQSTHCSETDTSYTCVTKVLRGRENKTTIVKYQCCHGFMREMNGGCSQVNLKGLVQTMTDLKANRMLQLVEKFGLKDKLDNENLTIFSPTDEAFVEFQDDRNKQENEVEVEPTAVRRRRNTDDDMLETVSMHMVPGFVKSGDFDDEQLLSSMADSKTNVRVNIYNNPKRVVTVNCARIVSPNNYATNGIVHIIDRVMPMPLKTIGDIINEDSRFSILRNIIANTELMNLLKDENKHLTFFAPTDEAFLNLEKTYLSRLLDGQACVESFLKNHITNDVLCSSAIETYAQVTNLLDLLLPLKRDDQKLQVDGIRISEADKLALNGVIHVISEGVLKSEKSEPISNYLEKHKMTEYLDLIKNAGLLQQWDSMKNVSFFIPSLEAIKSLSSQKMEEIRNNSADIMAYHVVNPQIKACNWNDDQILESSDGNSIRINVFEDIPGFSIRTVSTAQCAKIVEPNEDICGSNIHIVDRFLLPPKGNLITTLDSMEKFTIIRKILDKSGLESELENATFTLLAPNDETLLEELSETQLNLLMNDQNEAQIFARLHLIPEVMCCSGVNSSPLFISLQQIRTLGGTLISAHKTINGRVRFGAARVNECDIMTTNGVIHVINKVLRPQTSIGTGLQFPMFQFVFK